MTFGSREFAEKIFVNAAESVEIDSGGNFGDFSDGAIHCILLNSPEGL